MTFGQISIAMLLHSQYKKLVSKISFSNRIRASLFANTKGPRTSFQATILYSFLMNFLLCNMT